MKIAKTKLYKIDSRGGKRIWQIRARKYVLYIKYGAAGGQMQYDTESIQLGQGKKSRAEELQFRYNKRIEAKVNGGYRENIDDAVRAIGRTDAGFLKPMLASRMSADWDKMELVENYQWAYLQPKLNGHRCIVTRQGKDIVAYTRNGKYIKTIPHILSAIKLDEGQSLDGELYIHGMSLQEISSIIKRKQEKSALLKLHVYDFMSDDEYEIRYAKLKEIYLQTISVADVMVLTETQQIYKPAYDAIESHVKAFIKDGYEGGMLRLPVYGYEHKRSKSLIKIKMFQDDEFKVVDMTASADQWAILVCETGRPDGKRFNVCAPGNMKERKSILNNKKKYIGRNVTVKYAELTKDGKPFHPVALNFHEEI